jgi:GNAT superfamily N-acetyltransferase
MSDHLALLPGRPPAVLIARFVAESALEYPCVDDIDGRLYLWQQHRGCWVIAFLNREAVGIACVAHIDAGRYAGETCLYWIEVLPEARRQGVGRALLCWAMTQAERLLIMATPGAAEFYAHMLPDAQRNGLEFIVTPEQTALARAA